MSQKDYQGLRDFRKRLDAEYNVFKLPISQDKDVEKWLNQYGVRLIRIIDPVDGGMVTVESFMNQPGFVWLAFDNMPVSTDYWYFHPGDREIQMLFKLTWLK